MPESERRRRRPAISCALCRRRKIRCNREIPCSNCVRSKSAPCVYENPPPPPRQLAPAQKHTESAQSQLLPDHCFPAIIGGISTASETSTAPSHAATSMPSNYTPASSPADQASFENLESLKRRIQELERQLAQTGGIIKNPSLVPESYDMQTLSSGIAGTLHLQQHSHIFSTKVRASSRRVMHKTRLFGQSHWINGVTLFMDVFQIIEPYVRDQSSKATVDMARCKSLARLIKKRRAPSWPSPPTPDLPPKDIAVKLVDRYLLTSESVYRILHIPSFQRDFESLYAADSDRDMAFLVQVKLVLAIGAASYDEKFSLRLSAIRWIYEAQTWLWAPEYKSRLTIQVLQTNLLLLLARELIGVGGDLVWISAGSVLRTAIYMGLHVDPSRLPKRTTFAAEMRRRLWNTVLEISLQSSMNSGGPTLLCLEDFNTEPPGNLNDEQLLSEDPILNPEDHFTQVSIAIALRKTFPIRLAIARFLNSLSCDNTTYQDTLRLEAELRAVYKDISRTLRTCTSDEVSPSQFAIEVVDFIMRRYVSCLHIPYIGSSFYETTYAYSRKVVIDNALKVWAVVNPSYRLASLPASISGTSPTESDFSRLTVCGSGFYRVVAFQACLLIAAEVRSQLQEEVGLGPAIVQPHLLSIVNELKDWCLASIRTGETNIKGYLFASLIAAQIEGLLQGAEKDKIAEIILKRAEEAEETCLKLLTKMANDQGDETMEQTNESGLNESTDMTDEWDFTMSDELFDFSDINTHGWVFHDANMNEYSLW